MPGDQPSEQATSDSSLSSQADRAAETLPGRPRSEATEPFAGPPELADHPRYKITRLLGRGGMGSVYQAVHKVMDRPVALKVMRPDLIENSAAVERFRREVKTAAHLVHPNIVTAFDAEQVGDLHFLVMEYVDGQTLAEMVAKAGPLPVASAVEFVCQAAQGLQYAHERGMIHRDIKPHNLMLAKSHDSVRPDQTAAIEPSTSDTPPSSKKSEVRNPKSEIIKILDFGLARFDTDGSGPGQTSSGVMLGTVDFMAPEQADNARTADIRSDIYSLGCTLYYLLAGRAPFPDGSIIQRVMAHVEQPPPSLSKFRSDLPAGLIAVIEKMLAKSPADRYQIPAEVILALAPYRDGKAQPAALVTPNEQTAGDSDSPAQVVMDVIPVVQPSSSQRRPKPPAPESQIAPPPARKGRMLLGCFLLGVLAILSITGVVAYGIWLIVDRVSTGVTRIVEEAKHNWQDWNQIETEFTPPPANANDDRLFPNKLGDLERRRVDGDAGMPDLGLNLKGRRAVFGTGDQEVIVYVYHPVTRLEKEGIYQRALDAAEKEKKFGKAGTTVTSGAAKNNRISILLDQPPPFGTPVHLRCQMWWNTEWLYVVRTHPNVNPEPLFMQYLHWLTTADAGRTIEQKK